MGGAIVDYHLSVESVGWRGTQGLRWAQRNPANPGALDLEYLGGYGVTRTAVNLWALNGIDRDTKVLEVGCSRGTQLDALAAIGFTNLRGCDICEDALRMCRWQTVVADGLNLPYADGSFDVVMTSGTLMAIRDHNKRQFMAELCRVSRRWVYGVEGATSDPEVWEWGHIPPSWTSLVSDGLVDDPWVIARARVLQHRSCRGMALQVYLLENIVKYATLWAQEQVAQ